MKKILLLIAVCIVLSAASAFACSTFCLHLGDRIVFGKNYDWSVEEGFLIVNKRGMTHAADGAPQNHRTPAHWISTYGSVTFNQYGRNFPSGGINEAGLVVELLWAAHSRYPKPDERPVVDCLEWIQYQLDTAKTVQQVIASDAKIRIESNVPLHYLVADAEGNVAAIEFIGGKLVAHTGSDLPVAALTNDFYTDSLKRWQEARWTPTDPSSPARFIRAANSVKNFHSGDPINYAFQSLADVASAITQWSIVYEIDRGQIHFRTRSNQEIRTLALKDLDFDCSSQVLLLNLMDKQKGDIGKELKPFTKQANLDLIRSTFAQVDFLKNTADLELQRIAALPEQSRCRN
jgi:penicillin V acylase-like amidase (Ntn superfamily)